jgi:hypothetical protein
MLKRELGVLVAIKYIVGTVKIVVLGVMEYIYLPLDPR